MNDTSMPSTSEYTPIFRTPSPNHHQLKMLLKPKFPKSYDSKRDYNTIETWVSSVSSYLLLSQAQPPYIYHVLITLLEGEAAIWFRYHFPESCGETLTWATVRDALRSYFIPANKVQRLDDEWFRIRQTTSVPEYTTRFSSLAMELASNGQQIPNEMMIRNYIRGLKPRTRFELELKDPKTLAEAIQLADRFDQIAFNKADKAQRYEQNMRSPYASQYEDGSEPMQVDALRTNPLNKNEKLQKLSIEERTHLRKLGACFKCRQPGHMAKECPTNAKQFSSSSKNTKRQ